MARHTRGALPSLALTAALALGLALTGCLRDPDPIELDEDALAVHALLEAGADTVLVVVSRPAPLDPDFGFPREYRGVSGAEIALVGGTETTLLVEDTETACVGDRFGGNGPEYAGGCYRAILDSPLESGATYGLEITLPDGTRVTGETTIPAPPAFRTPRPGLRVTLDCGDPASCDPAPGPQNPSGIRPVATIPTAWDRSEGVAAVHVQLRPVTVYRPGLEHPGEACMFGRVFGSGGTAEGTLDFEIANVYCGSEDFPGLAPARFDSIRAELTLYGWSEHYAAYVENSTGQGIREESASPGLEGAYGVFGAMSSTARTIMLVRDPPPDTPRSE